MEMNELMDGCRQARRGEAKGAKQMEHEWCMHAVGAHLQLCVVTRLSIIPFLSKGMICMERKRVVVVTETDRQTRHEMPLAQCNKYRSIAMPEMTVGHKPTSVSAGRPCFSSPPK